MTHLLPRPSQYAMRVRQFRAPIEAQVYVTGIGCDVAESASGVPAQLEDNDLSVDGIQHLLCLGCLSQHQFAQCQRQMCDIRCTRSEEIEELRAGFSHESFLMGAKIS